MLKTSKVHLGLNLWVVFNHVNIFVIFSMFLFKKRAPDFFPLPPMCKLKLPSRHQRMVILSLWTQNSFSHASKVILLCCSGR